MDARVLFAAIEGKNLQDLALNDTGLVGYLSIADEHGLALTKAGRHAFEGLITATLAKNPHMGIQLMQLGPAAFGTLLALTILAFTAGAAHQEAITTEERKQ